MPTPVPAPDPTPSSHRRGLTRHVIPRETVRQLLADHNASLARYRSVVSRTYFQKIVEALDYEHGEPMPNFVKDDKMAIAFDSYMVGRDIRTILDRRKDA